MPKFLWIPVLLALFIIGDRALAWAIKSKVDKSQFRYSKLYNNKAQSDILLLGNSRGLIFFQPYIESITEKKSTNLSYNGLPIDLAETLIKDYYQRYSAPKTLLLEVTMCDRINNSLIAGFNIYSPYSNNIVELIKATSPYVHYGGKLSRLYLYNSELLSRSLFYLNKSDKDWLLDRVISPSIVSKASSLTAYTIEYKLKNQPYYLLDKLKSIINIAEKKGTTVKLLINPYYPAFAKNIVNLQQFKKEIETYTGHIVHDYSQSLKDEKLFGDYQHLNKKGARKYIDQLKKDHILNKNLQTY